MKEDVHKGEDDMHGYTWEDDGCVLGWGYVSISEQPWVNIKNVSDVLGKKNLLRGNSAIAVEKIDFQFSRKKSPMADLSDPQNRDENEPKPKDQKMIHCE